ncbi:hypothetical protein [Roseibacillus persicicus]|uniref:Uncharacterized protein n=1 Tax=Roseibacillus persicicus TaxID=454148 RepID=A0A918TPM9_9BACT|nr:hypothetical protein [Roseibacillus persicicus]GHC54305.1 hypothetical protein GCM10007100_20860 [Roseibacillus persicicus]
MEILALIPAIAASIFAGRFLFRFFFEDQEDFSECLRFSLTPDLISLFKGQLFEDLARSTKFGLYLLMTFLPGLFTYLLFAGHLSN